MPSDDEPRPAAGRMFTATRPPEAAPSSGSAAPSAADSWGAADPGDAADAWDLPERPLADPPGSGGPIGADTMQPAAGLEDGGARDLPPPGSTTSTDADPDPAAPAGPLFAGLYDAPDDDPSQPAARTHDTPHQAPDDDWDDEALHQAAGESATAAHLEPDSGPTADPPTDATEALWDAQDRLAPQHQHGAPPTEEPDDDALVLPEWQVPWTLDEDMSGLTAQLEQLVEDEPDDLQPAPRYQPQPLEPQPQPLEPEPQPLEPKPQPLEPEPQPLEPEPQPVEPEPQPQARQQGEHPDTRSGPAPQPTLRPARTAQPLVEPPAPPPTRVHERRIDQRPGPIRMSPSEALALVREGPGALRRGPRAR